MKLKLKTLFSQRDPQWSSILLGFNTSKYTIGTDGCLITSITNMLNACGYNETPATVNEKIKAVRGFVNGGWLDWGGVTRAFPDVKMHYTSPRFDGVQTPDSFFETIDDHLENNRFPILEVDFNPSMTGEQMHWVLVVGKVNGKRLILDPWTGTVVDLDVYGDPKNSCFMFRVFSPTSKPEGETTDKDKKIEELKDEIDKKSTQITKLEKKIEEQKVSIDKAIALNLSTEGKLDTLQGEFNSYKQVTEIELGKYKDLKDKEEFEYIPEIARLRSQKFTLSESIIFLINSIKGGVINESKI